MEVADVNYFLGCNDSRMALYDKGTKLNENMLQNKKVKVLPKLTDAEVVQVEKYFKAGEFFKSEGELRKYWLLNVRF